MGQARDEAGNIWEVDAQGNPVRLISQGAPQMPADPTFQYQQPKAVADLVNTQSTVADRQADNERADRAEQRQLAATNAQLYAQGLQIGPDGVTPVPIPGWQPPLTGAQRTEQDGKVSRLNQLIRQINRVQELYEEGPGKTKGAPGLKDYFPTDENSAFDVAGAQLSQQGLAAFRMPGTGNVSDRDAIMFDRGNLPTASTRDVAIEEQLTGLRARVEEEFSAMGLPPPQWTGTGIASAPALAGQLPNAMNYTRTDGGRNSELGIADAGATERSVPYPDAMIAEHDALVQRLLASNNNRLPPDVYAREKAKLAARFQRATDPASDEAWAGQINEYIEGGGATIPTGLQPEREAMGAVDQARNAVSQSFLGAGIIGAADALSYGSLQNIEPGKMSALANEGGWTQAGLTLGQIGGTAANTMGVGSIVGRAAARFAPQMLQGGKAGQFGRNLLGDTAYGAGYGEVTQGDAIGGATQAALGSTIGQSVGSLLGRGISGVTSSPTVSRLRDQSIDPTFGQIMRGRAADNDTWSLAAGIEDVFANNGVTGSVVNSARTRTLEQANNAALNIGGRGKGFVKGFGEEGIGNLADLSDSAYDDALGGVTTPPVDPADLAGARMQGAGIDAARNRGDFGYIYENQLTPVISGPQMSGKQIQDALRLLRGQSRSYSQAARGLAPDPAAQGVADALDATQDAITGHVGRYAPEVIPALDEANAIYRNFKVLDDAAGRALNDGGVFTGTQLGQAMKANNAKFGQRGFDAQTNSPFYRLQQDMQNVLPNQIPPTGVNAAPALAIGGAALGATGEATDNDYLRMGALATLPALAYTKPGQKAISTILLDRPDALRQFGESVRRRKGLFGSAAVPFALPLN